jgi:hypothetical protein
MIYLPIPILNNKPCPKCACALFIKAVDSVWCINDSCNYAEMYLVGNGTAKLPYVSFTITGYKEIQPHSIQ